MRAQLLLLSFAASWLPAQQILSTHSRLDYHRNFAPMGDVDGDGYEDVMVTSQIFVGPYWNNYDYELRIYSGRDGSLLRRGPRWGFPDQGDGFPTGDHDGDGIRDYICRDFDTATASRRLSVRSGRDDTVFWMLQRPWVTYWAFDIIGDIDINGDGQPDVVVSDPVGPSSQGEIWAYDHNGNLLYHLVGAGQNYSLAQSLAKLGDVNGDGCDDYIAGLGDPTWYGAVAVISGIDGQFLRIVTGQQLGDYIGSGCVGCGDLDGDGLPDFAAGGGLSGSYGSVQAFNGATGQRLFTTYSGLIGDEFGARIRAADCDHDGVADIVVASRFGGYVLSGRDGAFFPSSMASWGPIEAQPLFTPAFPRLLVSTAPIVYLMSAQPFHSQVQNGGCSLSTLAAAAPPQIGLRELQGHDRRITLHGAEPGTGALLLLGLAESSGGPLNLAPLGLPRCTVWPDLSVIGFFVTGSQAATAGYATHDFTVPSASAFGRGVDAQWLTLDTNAHPIGLSNAIRFAIKP